MIDPLKWDRYFLRIATTVASASKDPNTMVGCVVVGPDREIRATGYNGFPRGIADTPDRLNNRDVKLRLIVHGERNAVLSAARIGVSVKGCTLYTAVVDVGTGEISGGPPCTACAIEIIQSGIVEIVSYPIKTLTKWVDDLKQGRDLCMEAGLRYRQVTL